MVILEEKKLINKYTSIFKDKQFCQDMVNQAIFGFSEIKSYLAKKEVRSILEIGSGTGILLNEIKTHYPKIKITGLEPFQSGHKKYGEIFSLNIFKLNLISIFCN